MPNKYIHPCKYDRAAILKFIIDFKRAHDGIAPSMREMMKAFKIPSTSIMHYILADLETSGAITLLPFSRGIIVTGGRWVSPSPSSPLANLEEIGEGSGVRLGEVGVSS